MKTSKPLACATKSKPARRTLLSKILLWIFGPLFLLWTIGIVVTYFIAQHIANSPYDRPLLQQLELIRTEIGQQRADQPIHLSASARTVLRLGSDEPIYWQICDDDGLPIDGNAALPVPSHWEYEANVVRFQDTLYNGQSIRMAYVWGGQDNQGKTYLAQVAESNQHRAMLHHEILIGMLTPQFILVPLAALLAGLGLTHGLEPLNALQARLRARSSQDLSPINHEQAPAEIVPLLEAMNDLLQRQSTLNAAQRRFVANAAHQLKTPLAGIRTQVELAQKKQASTTSAHTLEQLLQGSERATRLVNQMLMLARAEAGELAQWHELNLIDLNVLAAQHLEHWWPQALDKQMDLGLEPSPSPAWVRGDSFMVGEMLNNLIENALLYTPPEGSITVTVGTEQNHCWLEVQDSGPGIPPELRSKVFDRFYRILGTHTDGSGLGLSIVQEIAELHQAQVVFIDKPASFTQGNCLRIVFPSAQPLHT